MNRLFSALSGRAAKWVAGGVIGVGVTTSVALSKCTHCPSKVDYAKVRAAIADVMEDENHDDGSYGPIFIRLAWHASGTFSKYDKTGGSEGARMRFSPECDHGANAGLAKARNRLELVKKQFPGISYSDLWTLAGVVAVEEMGGPTVPWRYGRKDDKDNSKTTPNTRLPDGDKGAAHIRDVFGRMGFNDREMVALLGAHAVGRCHTTSSGYDGPWTYAPTTFSNQYYQLLLDERWQKRRWSGPEQLANGNGALMMLPTEYDMINDPKMRKIVEEFARDEEAFFKEFAAAFSKLLELGCPSLDKKCGKKDNTKLYVLGGALAAGAVGAAYCLLRPKN